MSLTNALYDALEGHVADQIPSERKKMMISGGLLHYIVPVSMTGNGGRMACCCVLKPCRVHSRYFQPSERSENNGK